jgi:hypothetical protein
MRNIWGIALAAIIVFSITGCNDDTGGNTEPDDPAVITVEVRINATTPSVLRGGEVTFLASVKGTANRTVTWSIDEGDRHGDTTINTNERGEICLSVAEDETLETLTVRAVSNADPDKSGTVTVTIPVPTVEKVEISLPQPWVVPWQGSVDVGPGGEIEFTAKVTGRDFSRDAVTWSINNAGKHVNTTITTDDNGMAQLRVAQGETLASFKVQAVSKWDAGKIGEVIVTVKEPTVTGVAILDHEGKTVPDGSTNPRKIKAADSESFRAVVTGTGKVNQAVTWKIERKTYLISILTIEQDRDGNWTDGWGSEDLVIDLDDDTTEVFTWVKTGEFTSLATIYEKMPIERIPNSKEVIIWVTNDEDENEQKTLKPAAGTTGIDQAGKFIVDGQEIFGKFTLTATSTANSAVKKEIILQVDSSSDISIDIPDA